MLQWSMEASIIYRVHNQTARYQSKEKKVIGTSRHREQKIMKKIYGSGYNRDIWNKPGIKYIEISFILIPDVCENISEDTKITECLS